jgi:hypothetical protein
MILSLQRLVLFQRHLSPQYRHRLGFVTLAALVVGSCRRTLAFVWSVCVVFRRRRRVRVGEVGGEAFANFALALRGLVLQLAPMQSLCMQNCFGTFEYYK